MSRFGDFTLLEEHGRSATADRYKATHATLGGPFFLKVHRRLDARLRADWNERGNRLIGRNHPSVAGHLGHGVVGEVPFSVSPWIDGLDLPTFSASLIERRVHLGFEHCFVILADLAAAVAAIHDWAATPAGPLLAHGALTIDHVRLGPDGQVWLTGLTTPRGPGPGLLPEPRLDLAGVGALLYDLVPAMRGGAARPPLPTVLDRLVRRALGIGPASEHLGPAEFADRLADVAAALKLAPDRAGLAELVRRTTRAVEKKQGERKQAEAALRPGTGRASIDAIPELVPVGVSGGVPVAAPGFAQSAPLPIGVSMATTVGPNPLLLLELEPLPVRPAAMPAGPTVAPAVVRAPRPGVASSAADPDAVRGGVVVRPAVAVPSPVMPPPVMPPPVMPSPVMPPPVMPSPVMPSPVMPPPSPVMPPPSPVMPPRTAVSASSVMPPPSPVMPPPSPLTPSPVVPSSVTPPSSAVPRTPTASFRSRAPLLADADDSGATERPSSLVPPPGMEPPSPSPAPSLFERDRTDPDAVRPARLEAQKALPSVQALLRAGVVTIAQVESAAIEQAQRGGRTLEILVAHGATTDDIVAATLSRAATRPLASEAELSAPVDAALLRRLPQTYALARRLLPLGVTGSTVVLAVADPFDQKVIDEVRGVLHADAVDVRVAPRAALTRATLAAFGAAGAEHPAGPRVLLCLHDDTKAQQLGARLAQEGMQVEHVVEGETARQILSSRPPHAVVCAHDLPRVDGRALLLLARGQDKLAELPFYVVGPRGDDDLIARMLDLGADDVFTEPLRADVIVAKLRRAVARRVETSPPSPPPPFPRVPTDKHARPVQVASSSSVPSADEFAFEDLPDLPPEFSAEGPADDVPAMPTGVMGTLRQMTLPEIVQSLEMGRKTASVDIVPQDGEKGRIAFSLGSIQFAECGALQGDQAFYALMRHREGFFRIHYGDTPPAVNINAPTTFLLLEAMRLMDEGDR
jgi:DNA-binding response OmpR family regulator